MLVIWKSTSEEHYHIQLPQPVPKVSLILQRSPALLTGKEDSEVKLSLVVCIFSTQILHTTSLCQLSGEGYGSVHFHSLIRLHEQAKRYTAGKPGHLCLCDPTRSSFRVPAQLGGCFPAYTVQ